MLNPNLKSHAQDSVKALVASTFEKWDLPIKQACQLTTFLLRGERLWPQLSQDPQPTPRQTLFDMIAQHQPEHSCPCSSKSLGLCLLLPQSRGSQRAAAVPRGQRRSELGGALGLCHAINQTFIMVLLILLY